MLSLRNKESGAEITCRNQPKGEEEISALLPTPITVLRWNEKEPHHPSQKCFEYQEGDFFMAENVDANSQDMQAAEAALQAISQRILEEQPSSKLPIFA